MATEIVPQRIKELRLRHKLSQEQLAKRAKRSKQTIYRLETGRQKKLHDSTVESLCGALGVEAGVLTGSKPLPPAQIQPPTPWETSKYQLNIKIDGAIRNAFALTALRYEISVSRIVELAPLLFVLAAEKSLERRQAKLDELNTLFMQEDVLRKEFSHLPLSICPNYEAEDAFACEEESIASRDILGSHVSSDADRLGRIEKDYSDGEHNPFVVYLRESIGGKGDIAHLTYFDRFSETEFEICREDALALGGGDEGVAELILNGSVQLNEMPNEFWRRNLPNDAAKQRAEWLQQKAQEARQRQQDAWREMEKALGILGGENQ